MKYILIYWDEQRAEPTWESAETYEDVKKLKPELEKRALFNRVTVVEIVYDNIYENINLQQL